MKKFLSLALALVMTMSLVTISASATFTDDSDISYNEAVDVMYALEIIGGYTDGSFDPTATLTRGAACKIICNLMLGPTVAEALGTDTAPFPDVTVDHVFAGYIAYCANNGIVGGYADGYFYPANEVTGFQFMKMLLGALGYDADIEGYSGTNWSVNVAADAKSADLSDGNDDYTGSAAITREEACLYALNTLKAYIVEYENQSNITIGDIVISNSSSATKIEGSDYDGYTGTDYVMFFEEYFSKLEFTWDDTDAFGRPAVTWEYDGDDIGTYVDYSTLEGSYVGKVTRDTMYDLLGDDLVEDLEDDDSDVSLVVYVDGYKVTTDSEDITDYAVENSSSASASTSYSSVTEVFVSDDDDVSIVVYNTYLVVADDDYDDDDEILEIAMVDYYNGSFLTKGDIYDEIENDDVNVENFEEDDYILVTVAYSSGYYYVQSAELAEVIVGEVDSYSSQTSITLDGTKYYYTATIGEDSKNGDAVTFSVGNDASLVLDQYGNVIYVDEAIAGTDNYVFISAFDVSSSYSGYSIEAAAYFADGTYAEISIDEIYGKDGDDVANSTTTSGTNEYAYVEFDSSVTGSAANDAKGFGYNGTGLYNDTGAFVLAGNWFAYTYSSSSGDYDLYTIDSDYNQAATKDTEIANSTVKYDGTNRGNSDTVFVVYDGDDVYSYTGISEVPDVTISTGDSVASYSLMDGTYAAFVFINGSDANVKNSSANAADYVFVMDLDETWKDSSGDVIYTYNAIVDGKETTFDSYDDYSNSDGDVYTLYEELLTDGEYYELGDDVAVKSDAANVADYIGYVDALAVEFDDATISYSSSVLSIDAKYDDYDMYVDSDTEIYLVTVKGSSTMYDLMDDDNADYEVSNVSGSKLKSTLSDYDVTGAFHAVFIDDDSATLDSIYVVVSSVVDLDPDDTDDGDDGDDGYVGSTDIEWIDFDIANTTMDVTYYVESGSATPDNGDIGAQLEAMGATDVDYDSSANWTFKYNYTTYNNVSISATRVYYIEFTNTVAETYTLTAKSGYYSSYVVKLNGTKSYGDVELVDADGDVVYKFGSWTTDSGTINEFNYTINPTKDMELTLIFTDTTPAT